MAIRVVRATRMRAAASACVISAVSRAQRSRAPSSAGVMEKCMRGPLRMMSGKTHENHNMSGTVREPRAALSPQTQQELSRQDSIVGLNYAASQEILERAGAA